MQPDDYDEAAPFGRRPDGKPYTIPAEERAARAARMTAGRQAKAASGAKAGGANMSPPPLSPRGMAAAMAGGSGPKSIVQRRAAIEEFLALPIGVAAGVGKVWEPAMLDAMTLTVHAGPLAQGAAIAAERNEKLAKWIDKVTASSPYVPLVMSGIALLAQVAVNHGLMAPNRQLGSMSIDDMKDRFYQAIGAERPANDPRRDQVNVPDYPPADDVHPVAA